MNITSSSPISLALVLAILSLLPLLLLCTTSLLKFSVVLVIVRNAMGVQQVPPSMAVYAIALAGTMFVMAPTFDDAAHIALGDDPAAMVSAPLDTERMSLAAEPFRNFMLKNTTPEGRAQFLEIASKHWSPEMMKRASDRDFAILIPAFVVSQLQSAFEIGFLLYVPFIVIDLLVSNLMLALGMQMVSPMTVSMPLKLLLFVQIDGWAKLVKGLTDSYL
ncbi:type III secretion system export apparatus subunit SctR [Trinickia fusca]|uniref:EscR/YscR/HrcR family type III secretion system export apparatus protein n=1 Tax=Trinickia fusca TaxID=2419777 RepID=A0A494XFH5_9BURK|nr:type III secretion system export apparatus subunit SctR [Trinickia fusca]RKP46899.1 EscR/YscR/HrcR family type III secretion system export apparatus protein [Trinickia fusca]